MRLSIEETATLSGIAKCEENGIRVPLNKQQQQLLETPSGLLAYCFPKTPHDWGTSSLGTANAPTVLVPYHNILWCEPKEGLAKIGEAVLITYIDENKEIRNLITEVSDIPPGNDATQWICKKSYPNGLMGMSALVIINPKGGKGKAANIYRKSILPVLQAAKVKVEYVETKYFRHAVDIAREMDINKYDIVLCCSGDGIPHEVINGFYQRPDKGVSAFNKLIVTQLPCGSGNALTLSTHGTSNPVISTLRMLKGTKAKLDLMGFTQGTGADKKTSLSFLSQCYGAISDSDIGTEHLRFLGAVRFEIGVTQYVLSRRVYPCDVYVDYYVEPQGMQEHFQNHLNNYDLSKFPIVTEESLKPKFDDLESPPPSNWIKIDDALTSKLNIFYIGKMPYVSADTQFFPAALPDDGAMDLVITTTNSSVVSLAKILTLLDTGTHVDHDEVLHAKVKAYRLVPKIPRSDKAKHYLSIDGEDFPFEAFQTEVFPSVLTILLQDGEYVETSFKRN